MYTIYVVKSFGHQGYVNLKAFSTYDEADEFAKSVEKQIPSEVRDTGDEFVEVEQLAYEV